MQDSSLHGFWLPGTVEMLHQSLRHQKYVTLPERKYPDQASGSQTSKGSTQPLKMDTSHVLQQTVHAITLPKQTAGAYSAIVVGCVECAVCCNATRLCSMAFRQVYMVQTRYTDTVSVCLHDFWWERGQLGGKDMGQQALQQDALLLACQVARVDALPQHLSPLDEDAQFYGSVGRPSSLQSYSR